MSERVRGGDFLNLLQKGTQKGEGSLRKGEVPTPEENYESLQKDLTIDRQGEC